MITLARQGRAQGKYSRQTTLFQEAPSLLGRRVNTNSHRLRLARLERDIVVEAPCSEELITQLVRLDNREAQCLTPESDLEMSEMSDSPESWQIACSCKVGNAIAQYDLDSLNEELSFKRSEHGASLRDLTEFINQSILTAAMTRNAEIFIEDTEAFGALDREDAITSIYQVLTDDATSTDHRVRVETRLEQAGVDLDAVRSDWVTHPTVRTHLRECLNIDTSQTPDLEPDNGLQTIEWARSQCVAIVERTLERLVKAGNLSITDIDIALSIRVTCTACEETYRPTDLVRRGGCACDRSVASE